MKLVKFNNLLKNSIFDDKKISYGGKTFDDDNINFEN